MQKPSKETLPKKVENQQQIGYNSGANSSKFMTHMVYMVYMKSIIILFFLLNKENIQKQKVNISVVCTVQFSFRDANNRLQNTALACKKSYKEVINVFAPKIVTATKNCFRYTHTN